MNIRRAAAMWKTIDKWDATNPRPWYTYPAIEFINQLDLRDRNVFEFGAGASTIFWAKRCNRVVSVEDNEMWYDAVKCKLPNNVRCLLVNRKDDYLNAINIYSKSFKFDIIVIDGSHRMSCAKEAIRHLKSDGFIILDNSDWFKSVAKYLRQSNLIEVDMSGFGPINPYTWTTSFFLTRKVKFFPANDEQPIGGIGSLSHTE